MRANSFAFNVQIYQLSALNATQILPVLKNWLVKLINFYQWIQYNVSQFANQSILVKFK